ncbi:hypothetical protein FLAPJACK_270 [Bacillus phage Flapjack]|uniref:Uncharacterized protein n=1 Tax=Bacillus phage Flapjack TaxID=1983465 RepID=A0A1X9SGJ5_9CAUD|nr:hypothetical protein FLAPJACK_270 [Bacillus phage Flapjack]
MFAVEKAEMNLLNKIEITKGTTLKLLTGGMEFYMLVDVERVTLKEIADLFENDIDFISIEVNDLFKRWGRENPLTELQETAVLFHRKITLIQS